MDYEFLRDITGRVQVRLSMDHEAIGYWLNVEITGDLAKIAEIEAQMLNLKGSERQWQLNGHEYTLFIDQQEVMVRANQIDFDDNEIEDGMSYYDNESLAVCGLEDFLLLLNSYRNFMTNHKTEPDQ